MVSGHQQTVESQATNYNFIIPQLKDTVHGTGIYWRNMLVYHFWSTGSGRVIPRYKSLSGKYTRLCRTFHDLLILSFSSFHGAFSLITVTNQHERSYRAKPEPTGNECSDIHDPVLFTTSRSRAISDPSPNLPATDERLTAPGDFDP